MAGELKEKGDWVPLTPAKSLPARYAVKESVNCDNGQLKKTVEVEVPFGSDSTKASSMPMNQTPKKRSRQGIGLNRKPQKRLRMKRHRPKVFDESKPLKPSTPKPWTPKRAKYVEIDSSKTPLKPSTPKPRTPKRAKYVKKDGPKTVVDLPKDVEYDKNSCRQKLDFNTENCIMNQNLKVCDRVESEPGVEPKQHPGSRFSSLRVYQRKRVKKDSPKSVVYLLKDVDREAVVDYDKNSCREKLDFNAENCMNQNSKVCDGMKSEPGVEPEQHSGSRFSSWRVYQRIFRPNECLKNSRKLGPNCPKVFKRTRMRRQRVTVFDKYIGLVSMDPPPRKQRLAAMKEPIDLYSILKGRKTKSRSLRRRRKSSSAFVSTKKMTKEAVKLPTSEMSTLNLTWMASSKRKRSKSYTRRRDLSSFINDISELHVSEAFLLEASSIRTRDIDLGKIAACVEVKDEVIHHLAAKESTEQQEFPQDHVDSCNGSIQKYPAEDGDCMLGVETDIPEHDSGIGMFNIPVVYDESLVVQSMKEMESFSNISPPYLADQCHEENNVLESPDYDPLTAALVDFATEKMECLKLDDEFNQIVVRDLNAHGELVLSEGKFDPSKKRKKWPKVDLDSETMRVWNQLMENGGGENAGQEDNDKAKYWKEQRELFRGRIDSFIARMHLVQGDRRFSPWKGSVVDSVVGVYLTQNVSDNLSSSAFMSLAARFPPPSVSEHNGCDGRSDRGHEIQQVKIAEPPSGKCEEYFAGRSDCAHEIQQLKIAEQPSGKCEECCDGGSDCAHETQQVEIAEPPSGKCEECCDDRSDCAHEIQQVKIAEPSSGKCEECSDGTSDCAHEIQQVKIAEPPSGKCEECCDGRSDCAHEIQQVNIAEPPSGKCKELLLMEKCPSSCSSNQVGVDSESGNKTSSQTKSTPERENGNVNDKQENTINWDDLRKQYSHGKSRNITNHTRDSVDWEAVRQTPVEEVAKVIMERGMNNILAGRIKDFLDRIFRDHGSLDLEWLRDVPPDKVKQYLLSIPGLGLKSVECVRLLGLHHHAFPVDTNVGRILVRLGWVPLQPLPEDVQIHLLNQYPMLDSIQKYIWPRLCDFEQTILYESHCQFITCGKTFCTKRRPNCNACPMRGECRHYASAFASAKPRLEWSGENMATESFVATGKDSSVNTSPPMLSYSDGDFSEGMYYSQNCEPIVELPASPEVSCPETLETDIEDFYSESEIPTIKLNSEEFIKNVLSFMGDEDGMSKALVALRPEEVLIPMCKLKDVKRLRTVHNVYEIPDSHHLLSGEFPKREPNDPCPYLLAIWATDETLNSSQESIKSCNCEESITCDMGTCCSGETVHQSQNDQIVHGTILIPCRTANKGSFPLNGTYFQVNEVFADHKSSRHPIAVPREWIWNLRRRPLYCGTSITSICRGMSLQEIQYLFWTGFICIRGVDRKTGGPRPLAKRFHLCKSRQVDDE